MSNSKPEVERSHHPHIREALHGTVIITIVRAKDIQTHKKKIILELSNETNREQSQYSLHVKKLEGVIGGRITHTVEWNERFYYNTLEMVDDNITFTIREQNERDSYGSEDYLAKITCQSIGRFTEEELREGRNSQNRTLQLKNKDNQTAAELEIVVEFIQQQDIIGGVSIPCLSLAPAQGFKPKYNALDLYVPPQILPEGAQVRPENKYNCFNFYDGDKIPGFDQIDIFPAKFKEVNSRQKHKLDLFSVWE